MYVCEIFKIASFKKTNDRRKTECSPQHTVSLRTQLFQELLILEQIIAFLLTTNASKETCLIRIQKYLIIGGQNRRRVRVFAVDNCQQLGTVSTD